MKMSSYNIHINLETKDTDLWHLKICQWSQQFLLRFGLFCVHVLLFFLNNCDLRHPAGLSFCSSFYFFTFRKCNYEKSQVFYKHLYCIYSVCIYWQWEYIKTLTRRVLLWATCVRTHTDTYIFSSRNVKCYSSYFIHSLPVFICRICLIIWSSRRVVKPLTHTW